MLYRGILLVEPLTSMSHRCGNELDSGGKIILPSTVLDFLANQLFQSTMLFKLCNTKNNVITHCGVIEFVADEGTVLVPTWMLEQLGVSAGTFITVESVTLPVATFSRFQPQSTHFLDISNPKAVLENQLRKYACLTVGDIIALSYNDKIYRLKVEEARPNDAVTIIECDMEVDFSPPEGYVDPAKERLKQQELIKPSTSVTTDTSRFKPFSGQGHRLDGKECKYNPPEICDPEEIPVGIPDYDYRVGSIAFFRFERSAKSGLSQDKKDSQEFPGNGRSLD